MAEGLSFLESLPQWNGSNKFELGNLATVMQRLGDPQDRLKCIHVTGTNGKGSVSAGIAAVLGASGASVGLYTSPHLFRLTERIQIDGLEISELELDRACIEVKNAIPAGVSLSYFEALTAAAFLCFAKGGVDWLVLEVGLGGRLDGTNVIKKPAAAVIVSIDFDHEHILGHTLAEIAREKAGIIKDGCLVVSGPMSEEALTVIAAEARERKAKHRRTGLEFKWKVEGQGISVSCPEIRDLLINPSLNGPHQAANMSIVATTCAALGFSSEHIKAGISSVHWPARLEHVSIGTRHVLIDCAHNPAGVRSLVSYLRASNIANLELVFGVLDTKNWREMVMELKPYVSTWKIIAPDSVRALNHSVLLDHLSGIGISAGDFGNDYERLRSDICGPADICEHSRNCETADLLITGSIYMVGKLRAVLGVPERCIWKRGNQ